MPVFVGNICHIIIDPQVEYIEWPSTAQQMHFTFFHKQKKFVENIEIILGVCEPLDHIQFIQNELLLYPSFQ